MFGFSRTCTYQLINYILSYCTLSAVAFTHSLLSNRYTRCFRKLDAELKEVLTLAVSGHRVAKGRERVPGLQRVRQGLERIRQRLQRVHQGRGEKRAATLRGEGERVERLLLP